MTLNSDGTYTLPYNWSDDKENGVDPDPSRFDAQESDLVTGIKESVNRNGYNEALANLPMGGFKHTGVGDATNLTDYSSASQIQSASIVYAATVAGTVDAITVTLAPAPTAYTTGAYLIFKPTGENTGAVTIDVNSLGVTNVKRVDGSALGAGDIPSGSVILLVYDGTNFQIINPRNTTQAELQEVQSWLLTVTAQMSEDLGEALLMETGWTDSFGASNLQGADEANSTGYQYDATNDLYSGQDAVAGVNSDKDYTGESNYIQQEWTNSLLSTSQATVTNGDATVSLSSGSWPTNCAKGRISFDSGSTWYDIDTRTDATNIELSTTATESTASYDYIIRLSEIDSEGAKLTMVGDVGNLLLLHGDGADTSTTITDSGNTGHSPTANGNAQIDTAQSKFGGASILFDGTGDYISIPNHVDWDWNVDGNDFTVDFWVRFNSVAGAQTFWGRGSSGGDFERLYFDGSNIVYNSNIAPNEQGYIVRAWSPSVNTWYHIALAKSGDDYKLFVDGTQQGATATDSDLGTSAPSADFEIGKNPYSAASYLNGWIDEFRISSEARWTANFTPSTSAYVVGAAVGGERVSFCDSYAQKTDTSGWSDINSGSVTEALRAQEATYWLAHDPASGFGADTEVKIFNQTGGLWRVIAKNNAGTWQYNNNASHNVTFTGVNATVNDMLHAVSQAVSTQAANRMTGSELAAITDNEWEGASGWSTSTASIVRGVTIYSSSGSQTPVISQYRINHDTERSVMDIRSKAYDPSFVPTECYLWALAQHSTSDGPGTFYVSRNGGSEWATATMAQAGDPISGDTRVLRGTVDLSGQTSGQDLRCRYVTESGKNQYLHAWGLQAKQ